MHPPEVASLDEAHAAIEQWEHYSRKSLDSAQKLAVEHMMATRAEGTWAARTTGRAESRQNGKGDEIEVVEAWDLTQRAAPIVHSAHEIPTAKSAHLRLVAHFESHRDLRRLIRQVRYANGDQSIEMTNGGIVVYRTRTAGGGRGLDDIARLVVDEAQHAQPEHLASSTPILAVNPNPQTNYMGSAGITGRSGQWWALRKRALAGDAGQFAWLEHSAERVSMVDGRVVSVRPDPADVSAWSDANPGFPGRIPPAFLAEQLKTLGEDLFSREHLCVWDPDEGDVPSVFGPGKWEALGPIQRPDGARVGSLAIAAAWDQSAACITAAGLHEGVVHVKPLEHHRGMSWVVAKAAHLQDQLRLDIIIDEKGPAASLIEPLEAAGVRLRKLALDDVTAACAWVWTAVTETGLLAHGAYPELDKAISGAVQRSVGDRWVWGRRKSSSDISPLESVTLAAWTASTHAGYDLMQSFW